MLNQSSLRLLMRSFVSVKLEECFKESLEVKNKRTAKK